METTVSNNSHELLKILLDFIGTIIWPIVALIIALIFKKELKKLFDKAKKVELPGGFSIETVGEEISKAKELAKEIKTERRPEVQTIIDLAEKNSESKANKRMFELGLETSPSGLDLNYYKRIADTDKRLALVGLRVDFEMMLKNLAKGFKIELNDKDPVSKIISKLLNKGAITTRQYEFINTVFRITNAAAHGAPISKEQVYEVLEIGQVLVDDYIAWLDWGFKNS
jgi:hypothetical protein